MRGGYHWNPATGELLHHYQNIVFFPLQPLLDWLIAILAGSTASILVILVTLGFGIASIFIFDTFARSVLRQDAARWATIFFAFWPVSCFYIMGYPTGLISLCTIAALADHMNGRHWRSALWCGIGTAAAPTVVFVVAALGIDRLATWRRGDAKARHFLALGGWGVLSVAGLLGFMVYQAIVFHDPLAFVHAQAAWGTAPPLVTRLTRLIAPSWYVQQFNAGILEIHAGLRTSHQGGGTSAAMVPIEAGVQRLINSAMATLALIGLGCATFIFRRRGWVVPLAGWSVVAGYAWFIFSTNQNMLSLPRLMMPAIAIFLGLGWLAARTHRFVGMALLLVFAILSVAEAAFASAGYWVV